MKVQVSGIEMPIETHVGRSDDEIRASLAARIAQTLGLPVDAPSELRITRRSLDARRRGSVRYVYTVEVEAPVENSHPSFGGKVTPVRLRSVEPPTPGSEELRGRPVVVGAGPAGLFAAWQLAASGSVSYTHLTLPTN